MTILCTGHRTVQTLPDHLRQCYAQGTGFTSSASVTLFHPMHRAQDSRVPPNSSGGSQKSKKSEGRQKFHSNLMILMDSIGDLAPSAHLSIWSSHRRNPLDFALLREVQDKARSSDLGDLTNHTYRPCYAMPSSLVVTRRHSSSPLGSEWSGDLRHGKGWEGGVGRQI